MDVHTGEIEPNVEFSLAAKVYKDYAEKQKDFRFPDASIKLEENDQEERLDVHIDVEYNCTHFHLESLHPKFAQTIYQHLDSQPIVREKFGKGEVLTAEKSLSNLISFSDRFKIKTADNQDKQPNPYSGFAIFDSESDFFIGLCDLWSADVPGAAEIGYLNRAESWSHIPSTVIEHYGEAESVALKNQKQYQGVATTEVCTMLQYGQFLKNRKYKVCDAELNTIFMTARTDNPGSWKAGAKGGMELIDIVSVPIYGSEPRYKMQKKI